MERPYFDSNGNWDPSRSIKHVYGNSVLYLSWDNTQIFRYDVEDGKYDFIQHEHPEQGEIEFFLDETEFGYDLDNRGFRVISQGFVEPGVIMARQVYETERDAAQFAAELTKVRGFNDLQGI